MIFGSATFSWAVSLSGPVWPAADSEVAALKVEHLDGPGGYLHVVNGKGGRQRTSILPRSVLDALEAHLQGRAEGYVFEGRDEGHISTRQIQRLLDRAAEEAGLQETRPGKVRQRKRITPHLLRHSFSRWSLDAGIDISYLQHQLGHSSLTTTAIYLQGMRMRTRALMGCSTPGTQPCRTQC